MTLGNSWRIGPDDRNWDGVLKNIDIMNGLEKYAGPKNLTKFVRTHCHLQGKGRNNFMLYEFPTLHIMHMLFPAFLCPYLFIGFTDSLPLPFCLKLRSTKIPLKSIQGLSHVWLQELHDLGT